MEETIVQILNNACERFRKWLPQYKAWQGAKGLNGLTERNLTFQVATAFLSRFPDGMVFMEVPFSDALNSREDKHLDGYLFSDSLAISMESKIVYARRDVGAVGVDMDRMSPLLVQQLRARHIRTVPLSAHGLVIAETWSAKIADWWCGNDAACPGWDRTPLLKPRPSGTWHFASLKVHEAQPGPDGTLFWLYGISPELTPCPNFVDPV